MIPDDDILRLAARVTAMEVIVGGLLGLVDRKQVPALVTDAKKSLAAASTNPVQLEYVIRELDGWAATAAGKGPY